MVNGSHTTEENLPEEPGKKSFWQTAWFLPAVSAIVAAQALRYVFRFLNIKEEPIPFFLAWCAASFFIWKAVEKRSKPLLIGAGLFSAALSAVLVVGRQISLEVNWPLKEEFTYFIYLGLLLTALVSVLFGYLQPVLTFKQDDFFRKTPRQRFASWGMYSGFLLVCWLPSLLIYSPGMLSGDSFVCLTRAMGLSPINNQQPAAYQLFLTPFARLGLAMGDINKGILLYSVFQCLAMAASVGYTLFWLRKHGCPKLFAGLAAVYFVLNPTFGLYSITMWKDVLFGVSLLLLSLFLFDTLAEKGENLLRWRGVTYFVLLCLWVAFFRNNGIYILICAFVVLTAVLRKHWKKTVPVFLALTAVIMVVQGPVYRALGFAPSPFAESVGIPLQQMGRTVAQDGVMTGEQADYLDNLLPLEAMKEAYWPYTVDRIKFHEEFNRAFLEANKAGFFKTWFGMLIPNFRKYVDAYLMATYGYWHPGTKSWVIAYDGVSGYGDTYGVVSRNILQEWAGVDFREKLWKDYYEKFFDQFGLTGMTVSIGFMVWAAVLCAVFLILRKQKRRLVLLLPVFVLWLTLMVATPTYCEFRYLFSLALLMPVLVCLPFLRENAAADAAEEEARKAEEEYDALPGPKFGGLFADGNHLPQ